MSIPTVFSTANCYNSPYGSVGGGGMVQFCQTYHEHVGIHDYCWIDTQENYNAWQLGCVNNKYGTFTDNNNNTVMLEHKDGYMAHIDEAIEFPVDSHDNYYVLPAPHYEAPYPLILTESNCINTHTQVVFFCPMRPYWSQLETVAPSGACVVINDASLQAFAKGCVDSAHGSFINPIDGSTTTPEVPGDFTGTAPPYSFVPPPTDISTTGDFWTESEYLATHTDEIAETSSDDSNESFSSAETDIETDIYTTDSADTSSADTVSSVPENPAEVSTVVVYRCPA